MAKYVINLPEEDRTTGSGTVHKRQRIWICDTVADLPLPSDQPSGSLAWVIVDYSKWKVSAGAWVEQVDGGGVHPDLTAHDALGLQTDAEATTHAGAADPHPVYQKESEKGAVSGYASLDAGTKVPTVELGGAGAQTLDVLRGNQTWTPVPGLRIKSTDAANVSIAATGDNQAVVTAGSDITGVTFVFVQWLVEAAQAANAQFIVEGEIHQPDHTVLETFRYRFDATGAGDIAQVAAGLFAVASPATGVYHLNMTTVTLGGGTFTVKQRLMLFNF